MDVCGRNRGSGFYSEQVGGKRNTKTGWTFEGGKAVSLRIVESWRALAARASPAKTAVRLRAGKRFAVYSQIVLDERCFGWSGHLTAELLWREEIYII